MQEQWWYSIEETRKGPVSTETLQALLTEGTLTAATLVWKEGMSAWTPLDQMKEFKPVVLAVPLKPAADPARDVLLALPFAGPWRRFFARFIDLWTISLPTGFIVAFMLASVSQGFAQWIQQPGSEYLFGWLTMPIVLALEGVIFSLFGTTLGKGLLGVKVTTVSGHRLTSAKYFERLRGVYWYGLGTGFPLINLFTMARQHGLLKNGQQAAYDKGQFNVRAGGMGIFRMLLAVATVLALLVVNGVLQAMSR